VPVLDEMTHSLFRSGAIFNDHRVGLHSDQWTIECHHGQAGLLQILQALIADAGRGDNKQARDFAAGHQFRLLNLEGAVTFRSRHQRHVAMGAGQMLHGMRAGCKKAIRQIGNDEADQHGSLALEQASSFVLLISQFGNGGVHFFQGAGAHVGVVVDDPRNGHQPHAGQFGHIANGGLSIG
jgi:hypothetical protein